MVKKSFFFVGLLLSFILSSCTDLLFNDKSDNSWLYKKGGNVVIYYRPANYSGTPSPTSAIVDTLLVNQNLFYKGILDSLHASFNGTVLVYLYNNDEAQDKIGTNGGGHGSIQLMTYHYTYFPRIVTNIKVMGIKDRIGAHELVHVITCSVLAGSGSKLFP